MSDMSLSIPPELATLLNSLDVDERAELIAVGRAMKDQHYFDSELKLGFGTKVKHAGVVAKRVVSTGTSTVVNKVKRIGYGVKNTVFNLCNWLLKKWNGYMVKHPKLHYFLSIVLAFTVGFVGFMLLYSAIILSVIAVALFIPV
jgi:hypothetical protein